MPCVICGRNSAGSDICPRCEEIERERDWERQHSKSEEEAEQDEARDSIFDPQHPSSAGL